MRTDILGHPPSLCNCRRVWHPAIPTHPTRGCSGLHCTNQARTAPTKLPLHPPTARDFCVFCVFRGTILRNLNICVHLCHLWEDYLGLPHAPTQGVQLSQLHQPSCHCIFPQNSQNFLAEENFCAFCVFRGTILRNLNICVHLCHLWEDY